MATEDVGGAHTNSTGTVNPPRIPFAHVPAVLAAFDDAVGQLSILAGIGGSSSNSSNSHHNTTNSNNSNSNTAAAVAKSTSNARGGGGGGGGGDVETVVGTQLDSMAATQQGLELKYTRLMGERTALKQQGGGGPALAALEQDMGVVAGELKHNARVLSVNLRQHPGTAENLLKLQRELHSLRDLICEAQTELRTACTYETLVGAVATFAKNKEGFAELVATDERDRETIKLLRAQMRGVREGMEKSTKEKDAVIRQLKDQLGEVKTASAAEVRYMKKETAMRFVMAQKDLQGKSKALSSEAAELQREIEEENTVNTQVEDYLRNNYKVLTDKLDYWMTKYERDNEDAQRRLDTLKSDRARDLFRLQELTEKYGEFERVVHEDRAVKDKQLRLAKQV